MKRCKKISHADDIILLTTYRKIRDAEKTMQKYLDQVANCTEEKKLKLNKDKTSYYRYAGSSNKWEVNIKTNNSRLKGIQPSVILEPKLGAVFLFIYFLIRFVMVENLMCVIIFEKLCTAYHLFLRNKLRAPIDNPGSQC